MSASILDFKTWRWYSSEPLSFPFERVWFWLAVLFTGTLASLAARALVLVVVMLLRMEVDILIFESFRINFCVCVCVRMCAYVCDTFLLTGR